MATLADLRLKYRLFMKTYRYRTLDWQLGAVLRKSLQEARIAAVTTAGYYCPDQPAFDESVPGGDFSYRVVPIGTDLQALRIGHQSDAFDSSGIGADKNVALPLDRLRELVAEHVIGSVASRHFSFMGSITAPARLVAATAPEVAAMLRDDRVDGVLLTPV